MAYRNDGGGNFSDDPFARLIAMKLGSMSNNDLAKQEQVPQDAINTASQVMGSVQGPKFGNIGRLISKEAPAAEDGLAKRIQDAVSKTNVRQMPGEPPIGNVTGPEGGIVTHNNPLTAAEREAAYGKVTGPEGGITGRNSSRSNIEPDYNPAEDENLDRLKRLRELLGK